MYREFKNYPSNIVLETPLGNLGMAVTQANHICLTEREYWSDDGRVHEYLTINGVQASILLHLGYYNGAWELWRDENGNTYHSFYATRQDWHNGKMGEQVSDAAKAKILKIVLPLVNKYMDDHPELTGLAQAAHINNKLRSLESEIEKSEEKLAELRQQESVLLEELATLPSI